MEPNNAWHNDELCCSNVDHLTSRFDTNSVLKSIRRRKRKAVVFLLANGDLNEDVVVDKMPNKKRASDWESVVARIVQTSIESPALFKKMFRLDRKDFWAVYNDIKEEKEHWNEIPMLLKFAVTLRWLAGGSYLDLAWGFHLPSNTIHQYFYEVLRAIDKKVVNIKFPMHDVASLNALEAGDDISYVNNILRHLLLGFSSLSGGLLPGTVAAGDGIVFQISKPKSSQVNGDVSSFFTRKGYFAYGLQAFVSSTCKFLSIASKLCSSSHDSTAYIVTQLAQSIKNGELPPQFHVVLDDAYVCTNQELTPWKGRNLSVEKDAFNYYLSKQRQVVERAFGLLVQRWGIFWRPIRVDMNKIPLIISVACKLHNICVDRFGLERVLPFVGLNARETDIAGGDDSNALYTDGTGMQRGHRSDRDVCTKRAELTCALRTMRIQRPENSISYKLRRIRNASS